MVHLVGDMTGAVAKSESTRSLMCRDAHHAPWASYFEAQLPDTRALVKRLRLVKRLSEG